MKIVEYTINIGNYDSSSSDIISLNDYDKFINNARNSRMAKILPHKFFDCDVSIYWDSHIIKKDISKEELVEKYLGDADMAANKHKYNRNCVYQEIEAAKTRIEDHRELRILEEQGKYYRSIGFPEKCGTLANYQPLIIRHNDRMKRFLQDWWAEMCRWSYRDQVSFPVVLSRHDIKVNWTNELTKLYTLSRHMHNKITVDSHNQEFGYELLSAVPYAYELFLQDTLKSTRSGIWSEPLYYFSPKHEINPEERAWEGTAKARSKGLPYTSIHKPYLQPKKFPPYKEIYANKEYKWKKPILCICNRANVEWQHEMINYFDAEILDWLFENLKKDYEIVYFPVSIPKEIQDNIEPTQIGDIEVAKKHKVKIFTDLLKGKTWNEVLLRVFANCEHYITMNGGYSILASYFSGTNIIYSKPGVVETKEIKASNMSFWRWYPNINNVRTLHVPSYEQLKEKVQAIYIDKLPTANVLIRTSGRPNGFRNAIMSVLRQDYPNVNIVVICDDKKSLEYTMGYACRVIEPEMPVKPAETKIGYDYGKYFPYNDYTRQAQERVKGFILGIDDDDIYLRDDAISTIMSQAKSDHLTVWKVKFPDNIIPNGSFGKNIELYDITGIGMCWHSDTIDKTDWSVWKKADYRTARNFDKIIWINEVLTGLQGKPGYGFRKDVAPQTETIMKLDPILSTDKYVKVQFVRNFQNYKAGEIVELKTLLAKEYNYRQACVEVIEKPKKEEKQVYQTKEEKPKVKKKVVRKPKKAKK